MGGPFNQYPIEIRNRKCKRGHYYVGFYIHMQLSIPFRSQSFVVSYAAIHSNIFNHNYVEEVLFELKKYFQEEKNGYIEQIKLFSYFSESLQFFLFLFKSSNKTVKKEKS